VLNPAQKYTVGPRSKLLAALALLASATTGAIASDSVEEAGQQLYLSGHAAPVDGTRTINLLCMGSGSPTVILTAGLGDWGAVWSKVQPEVAKYTRVCAWDRAGAGFSDGSSAPQTVAQTTSDLERAIERSGITGPYVMVGHSLGSLESLLFTDRHSNEVAGLVFVDPSYPGQARQFERVAPALSSFADKFYKSSSAAMRRCSVAARNGDLKPDGADPDGCLRYPRHYAPELARELALRDASDSLRFESAASLIENFKRSTEDLFNLDRRFGSIPLIVLTATKAEHMPEETPQEAVEQLSAFMAERDRAHEELSRLSTSGERRLVPTEHYIQLLRPDTVISAIVEVVGTSRTEIPNKPRP